MFSSMFKDIVRRACVCYVWDCGNKHAFRSHVHFIAVQLYHQRRHFTCSHTDWRHRGLELGGLPEPEAQQQEGLEEHCYEATIINHI